MYNSDIFKSRIIIKLGRHCLDYKLTLWAFMDIACTNMRRHLVLKQAIGHPQEVINSAAKLLHSNRMC